MTSKDDIRRWFEFAIEQEATHILVVRDSFDNECYPVYVSVNENVHEIEADYNRKAMQSVIEVYNVAFGVAQIDQAKYVRNYSWQTKPLSSN